MRIREAEDGDRVVPGHVLIAPGGTRHMQLVRNGAYFVTRLVDAPPVNHHRPSVDILFQSCAQALGPNAIGAILTGMGGDGAAGMLAMHRAGARTVAQDEATSVVFGMPKEAILLGGVDVVAPLERVAQTLLRFVADRRPRRSA
jgi:two-component system chemotaxis response regulator CheB